MRTAPDADATHRQLRLISFALASGVLIFAAVVGFTGAGAAAEPIALETPIRITTLMVAAFMLAGARALTERLASVPPGTDRHSAAARLLTAVLAGQGIREMIGLAGGLIGYLAGDVAFMAVLAMGSAVTIMIAVPSPDEVRYRLGGR